MALRRFLFHPGFFNENTRSSNYIMLNKIQPGELFKCLDEGDGFEGFDEL